MRTGRDLRELIRFPGVDEVRRCPDRNGEQIGSPPLGCGVRFVVEHGGLENRAAGRGNPERRFLERVAVVSDFIDDDPLPAADVRFPRRTLDDDLAVFAGKRFAVVLSRYEDEERTVRECLREVTAEAQGATADNEDAEIRFSPVESADLHDELLEEREDHGPVEDNNLLGEFARGQGSLRVRGWIWKERESSLYPAGSGTQAPLRRLPRENPPCYPLNVSRLLSSSSIRHSPNHHLMPTTKAAAKALRQSADRQKRNLAVKRTIKDRIKHFRKAVAAGNATAAQEAFRAFVKMIDRAAQKRVIPRNRAARKKSRLAKLLKTIGKT